MPDVREKLVELLESAESAIYWNSEDKGFVEKIADHLIANGVTIPIRCKDCTMEYGCRVAQWLGENGFCSYGERKDND